MAKSALTLLLPVVALADVKIPTQTIAPGVHMPVVSIGSWTELTKHEDQNISAVVGNWLDLGGRGIDTAWMYFDQKDVARVIAEKGIPRKDLFITTKLPTCLGAQATKYFVEYDLSRLNTTYLDLMLIHAPGLPGPLGGCHDTWATLEEYHAKGILRSIGVSNWAPKHFKELMPKAKVVPAVNQVQYNVFSFDKETEAYCSANNITIEAWSPLGDSSRTHKSVFKEPKINSMAKKYNVSEAQVALRWIVQKGHALTFLSSNKAHQESDADIFNFALDPKDVATLDSLTETYSEAAIVV